MKECNGPPVIIAATHRCGSYLFCDLLAQYGGLPLAEEYLNADMISARRLLHEGMDRSNPEILDRLSHHFRRTGQRLIIKAMWPAFMPIFAAADDDPFRQADVPAGGAVRTVIDGATFFFVRRRDKVRQAVSFARALQTGVWRERVGENPVASKHPLHYSYRSIYRCHAQILADEAAWMDYFEKHDLTVHEVWYEDLISAASETLEAALTFLDVKPVLMASPAPGVRPVSDEINAQWARRFSGRLEGTSGYLPGLSPSPVPVSARHASVLIMDPERLSIPARSCSIIPVRVINRGDAPWVPYAGENGLSSLSLSLWETEPSQAGTTRRFAEEDLESVILPGGTAEVSLRIEHDGRGGPRHCTLAIREGDVDFDGGSPVVLHFEEDPVCRELERIFGQVAAANWKDWFDVPVFGTVYSIVFPWIYQFEHGWVQLLVEQCRPGVVVLEDPKIGRLRIDLSAYPEMVRLTQAGEVPIRFEGVENNRRVFMDLNDGGCRWEAAVNEPETLT